MTNLRMDITSERNLLAHIQKRIADPSTTSDQVTELSQLFLRLIAANNRKLSIPTHLRKYLPKGA